MDFNYEEEAIEGLELDPRRIRVVAELCSKGNELAIAKMIEKDFAGEKQPPKKTALLLLISEILMMAKANKNTQFFKHLSPKLTPILSQLDQIIIDMPDLVAMVGSTLNKWQTHKLFAEPFLNRLKASAAHILQRYQEEGVQQVSKEEVQPSVKYNSQFLKNIKQIRRHDLTTSIYDNESQRAKVAALVAAIRKEHDQFKLCKGKEQTRQGRELLQRVEECLRRCEEAVCNLHSDLKGVVGECEQPFGEITAQER